MRLAALITFTLLIARAATAHEFWIAPESYRVEPDAPLVANLRVGQDFAGTPMSYFPNRFARFDVRMGESVVAVEGRLGDIPAMRTEVTGEGLAVVVHQTEPETLQYRERALFEHFIDEKDLGDVVERHSARGLPELEFLESYTRYAKSLMAVGSGGGSDEKLGLLVEVVAEANPYTDDLSAGFPVRLFYQEQPRTDVQIEVFARATDGRVSRTKYRTDGTGRVRFPVEPGVEYLVDSVVMEDTGNDDPEAGPVWHSAWASLTFKVP